MNRLFLLLYFFTVGAVFSDDPEQIPTIRFIDRSREAGLHAFHHRLGNSHKRWIIDAMGSGVAVGDYDNDGDDDLYFVNGRPQFDQPDPNFRNALFRNDGGVFTDVTQTAGAGDLGFGMCALFGDIDNDGWLDLFVGNYGPNVLFHNNGDGTFTDQTDERGLQENRYAASSSFTDVDGDGDLDLFVGNYIDFDPSRHGHFQANFYGQYVFMGPMQFDAQRDWLYLNDGNGVFKDSSYLAQINVSRGRAMGSVFFDLENDGDPDLYVTNDSTYNHILKNRGGGVFEDLSFLSGGGFSDSGRGGASMGISAGDYNNDGFFDLYITSYDFESDVLYRNEGDDTFFDVTAQAGLFSATLKKVTWGSGFCDFNADGFLDLYTVNGHVYPQVEALDKNMTYPQGASIYQNAGRRFQDVSQTALPPEIFKKSGRGSALIDFDNDGDMDVVVNCMDSTPLLLENQSPRGHWLQVKLEGTSAQTCNIRVAAKCKDKNWIRQVDAGSGYLSQNSSILHFGFGEIDRIDSLTVFWRHCDPQTILQPALDRLITIHPPQE
ncbi:MAG: CRTAC1 family protein [Candidatus Omnitrophica bacterium]|nr:CRTAC1 family protein [Candidatus Omnitrophota bacterium]